MKKSLLFWQIVGFIFTGVMGVILHFLFGWTNQSTVVAPFSAVNESIWEHMKILFFPMLVFAVIENLYIGKIYKSFWCVKLMGIVLGVLLIPILYYTINGAFGMTPDFVNIVIFYVTAAICFIAETLLLNKSFINCKSPKKAQGVLGLIALIFVVFTFLPPKIPLFTKNGTIKAKAIIVATHFPFLNKHGSYFLKLYQERSYVTAYKNVSTINGMYLDENIRGLSFRSYNDMLLIGGNNHRTGKKSTAWEPINDFAGKHYPKGELMFQWANQDCMSLDNIPYIGQYSKNTPNLYVATGFNKWGMTSSMVSAMILSDMIDGRKNDYEEIFSPQRTILKPQLFINGFESTTNLLTPIPKRCSHLGCALKWNKYEHTWDCPCHGSRFEENGRIIDNPAMKNIKKD